MNPNDILSALLPRPKHISFAPGVFDLALRTAAAVTADFPAAERLRYLLGLAGVAADVRPIAPEPDRPDLLHLAIGEVPADWRTNLAPSLAGQEAYALAVDQRSIRLAARSPSGMAFGLKTLAKLVRDRQALPAMVVQDAPSLDFRGLHLCIFRPDDGTEKEDTAPDDIRRMLRLAALTGYRYVFLEFWGMFPYQRRPYAVWPNTLYTPEVVRGLIDHAIDDLHLCPLPCQNLTSHAGWSRIVSRQHVVLDQRPDLAAMWIPGGWCFATENPDTKAFLQDVIEELLDAYRRPPLFHVCCDKAFGFGSTEADRTRSADLLFGNHLCFLNGLLQDRGTRMAMWADMLYTSMDALYWKASPGLVEMLPRNILMNLWTHNDPGVHWPDVEFFESRGFQTIYSPFLDRRGVASMADVCLRRGSHGILQTTWHRPQTARAAVVYSGACQWSGAAPPDLDLQSIIDRWY